MSAGRNINSQSTNWCTPFKYVKAVKEVFGGAISLDPCSNQWSIVDAKTTYSLPNKDGLKESWDFPTIYVNPPYGSDKSRGTKIKDWLRECCHAHFRYKSEVLALIPVATNTSHWKECIFGKATAICFLYDTRLRFLVEGKDEGSGAPMSCSMVYWGIDFDKFSSIFNEHGAVIDLRLMRRELVEEKRENIQPNLFECYDQNSFYKIRKA